MYALRNYHRARRTLIRSMHSLQCVSAVAWILPAETFCASRVCAMCVMCVRLAPSFFDHCVCFCYCSFSHTHNVILFFVPWPMIFNYAIERHIDFDTLCVSNCIDAITSHIELRSRWTPLPPKNPSNHLRIWSNNCSTQARLWQNHKHHIIPNRINFDGNQNTQTPLVQLAMKVKWIISLTPT